MQVRPGAMKKTKILAILAEAPSMPKCQEHMEIHTLQTDNGALLSHAIKWQRSQGLCCGCKIYCGGWGGGVCGNVISMLRQELRQDLHGHETPPTFLGSPAFVCMSYTFVSRGDSFCQSFKSSERKKRKKKINRGGGLLFPDFSNLPGCLSRR